MTMTAPQASATQTTPAVHTPEQTAKQQRALKKAQRQLPRPRAVQQKMNRWRNLLLALMLPLTMVTLLFGFKVFTNYKQAYQTNVAYEAANYTEAVDASRPLHVMNIFEKWKAPFNTGTAYAIGGAWPEAIEQYEAALELAVGAEQCPVRANYSFVVESQGDDSFAAGDYQAAIDYYALAKQIADEAPEACDSPDSANDETSDSERDLSQSLDDASDRDQDKSDQAQELLDEQQNEQGEGGEGDPQEGQGNEGENESDPNGGEPGQGEGNEGEQQQPQGSQGENEVEQELRDRMQQGQQERDEVNNWGGGGGAPVEKPW